MTGYICLFNLMYKVFLSVSGLELAILLAALSHTSIESVLIVIIVFKIALVALHSNTLLYLPLHLTAPSLVTVQVMSADSIKVSWTPVPTASSVSVTYYINTSSSTYQTVRRTASDPDREEVISGLHPFVEYHITVQAGNSGGLSEPTGRSVTTLTAGVCTVTLQSSCQKLSLLLYRDELIILTHMILVTIYMYLAMQ